MEKRSLVRSSGCVLMFLVLLVACNPRKQKYADIPTDSVTIARGENAFAQNCSACHDFRRDGIGPQLGGVTRTVSTEWLREFIKNPQAVVESGDERGEKLLARYKTLMPSFAHYTDQELTDIIAFLHTQEAPVLSESDSGAAELVNPLPEPIQSSSLVVGAHFVTEIPRSSDEGVKTRITKLDFIPGSQRTFIVDIRGKLYELHDQVPKVYMDMARLKPGFIDKPGLATGFGSFAFHPEFLRNGLLYTSHTEAPGAGRSDFPYADSIPVTVQWVISEWKADQPGAFPFKGNSRELFRVDMVTGMHGVQELTFNPNSKPGDEDYGLLYIGIGDGACVQYGFPALVQNIEKPWGSIFRIDPAGNNSRNKKYGIPQNNPLARHPNTQALGEIYAYGFRNPTALPGPGPDRCSRAISDRQRSNRLILSSPVITTVGLYAKGLFL